MKVFLTLFLCISCLSGCFSLIPSRAEKEKWEPRIGWVTYDQVVTEYGPPITGTETERNNIHGDSAFSAQWRSKMGERMLLEFDEEGTLLRHVYPSYSRPEGHERGVTIRLNPFADE